MAKKPNAPPREEIESHPLARGEKVIAQRDNIAVTSDGRKVILDGDGKVLERLVGPAYAWELPAARQESGEDVAIEE